MSHDILPSRLVGQNDVLSLWYQVSNPTTDSKLPPPHVILWGTNVLVHEVFH